MVGVVNEDLRPGPNAGPSDPVSRDVPPKTTKELDAGDSDSENEATQPKRHGISERRRQQYSIFDKWRNNLAANVTKEQIAATYKEIDDERLSLMALVAKHGSSAIIGDPREYQIELFEKAKHENIIAVLDTGSGKTLIAVLLLRYVLDKELESRAAGNPPKIAFFLVDSTALVCQQSDVLNKNLDKRIQSFWGSMGCKLWDKQTWENHYQESDIIVCTAEILRNCLALGFIAIERINILIFDEAHHAKKNHPYSRIIREFYLSAELEKRPKVFGMTASPVDAKVDVVQAAKELETLLHSKIATTKDLSLLRMTVSRPEELVVFYDHLPRPYNTPVGEQIELNFSDVDLFRKHSAQAKEIASELGEWCADRLWSLVLSDPDSKLMQGIRKAKGLQNVTNAKVVEDELKRVKFAKEVTKQFDFETSTIKPQMSQISSKVQSLKQTLDRLYKTATSARCIVFVKKRNSAKLLKELFDRFANPHLMSAVLVGVNSNDPGDMRTSFREQHMILKKFHDGTINLIFATSIAEEGLDIPDCNTVIRFDLWTTLIQYIQSRGRARHKDSQYYSLIERGNREHEQILKEARTGESLMKGFCEALPEDRILRGNNFGIEDLIAKEKNYKTHTNKETGAKLTFHSALQCLAHFVASLPKNDEVDKLAGPTYYVHYQGKKFICEVVLPPNSPIRSVFGTPYSKKTVAKCSAAFEACVVLRQKEYLNSHLLPIYHKYLPLMRNARLALSTKATNLYDMRVKSGFWTQEQNTIPSRLFVTVIDLSGSNPIGRPHLPLAILTRNRLPDFPSFPIHPQADSSCDVLTNNLDAWLDVNSKTLSLLTEFTLRIFYDLFNKKFEHNEGAMSYWLAPLKRSWRSSGSPEAIVDWDILDRVQRFQEIEWTMETPHADLADRFLIDKWDGGRRFYSLNVAPEYTPQSKIPPNCAPHKYGPDILNYTISLFLKSRARITTWNPNQPVLHAYRIPHRRNWLDEWDNQDKQVKTLAYVIPQPLRHSVLPTPIVAMSYIFPAIITRIEAYLVTLEACDLLGLKVRPDLALEAMTKDSDNTEEHRAEQVQYQRGMGKNYERLEFIGDAFLKMSTSISLYAQNANDDEFESHVKRMLMVCNATLFKTAKKLNVYEYIRSEGFNRRTWYPEGMTMLEGKMKDKKSKSQHSLNDKTVADVCEALIGAALLSYKDTGDMDMAVKAVTAFVDSENHTAQAWADYWPIYQQPAYQTAEPSAAHRDLARMLFKEAGYEFEYPRLARCAFTHPSCPFVWERIPSYQRLEFLGDALLDMVCVNHLFFKYPDKDPQWLTEHKMAMVSNKFLGALCVKLGFHKHLQSNTTQLLFSIQNYVLEIEEAEKESKGSPDYWTATKNPPKCLPDVVESYIGAIFVDAKFDFSVVEKFFANHVRSYFEDMTIYDTFANNHPTTFLSNLLTLNFGCTHYSVLSEEMPIIVEGTPPRVVAVVMIHFQIVAHAEAASGKYAKIKASQRALDNLTNLGPKDFRSKFGCDCKEDDEHIDDEDEMCGEATKKVMLENIGSAI